MKRLTLAAFAAALFGAVGANADGLSDFQSSLRAAPILEQLSDDVEIDNGSIREGLPVARPSQTPYALEGPGIVQTTLNHAPASNAAPVAPVGPQQPVAAPVVAAPVVTAAVVPVGTKFLMVQPLILDLLMADTMFIGPGVPLGPDPGLRVGGLPQMPVDQVSVLPDVCVGVCGQLPIMLPEACTLANGQQLRAVLMLGGQLQLVPLTLTDACTATITLPNMVISTQIRATLLIGTNTGDLLYEQPLVLGPVVQ